MKRTFSILCLLAIVACASANNVTVTSPNGNIVMTISDDDGLWYTVAFKGRTVLDHSPISFEFVDEKPLGDRLAIIGQQLAQGNNDTWRPVVANKHSLISVDWNQADVQLRETDDDMRRVDMEARVYDDGVAFRFRLFCTHSIGMRQILDEKTRFALPAGTDVWLARQGGLWKGPQEERFSKMPLDSINAGTYAMLPLLAVVNTDTYLAITDAYLDNYPGFFLCADADGIPYTKLASLPGQDADGIKARFDTAMQTPWRVVMIGDNLGTLVQSELVRALNPPCAIDDPSWIKPGISAWDHWWSGEVKMEMPVIKQYIDFASEQGWPYMLVDWQWYGPFNTPEADIRTTATQIDMPQLLEYAKQRNVRLWLWMYCNDVDNNSGMEEAFALYEKWGIAGVKIDFMDRVDQDMVNWYRRVCQAAASHHLMVDFHGAYHPDGIERTYPNQMTREGVMGEEYYKWSDRMVPEHNVTLAFTRQLAGAMDYTPGGFINMRISDMTGDDQANLRAGSSVIPAKVYNTRCAELAKFVVYESPLTVFSDHPSHVLGQTGADFVACVPTVWDDIRLLGGAPDTYVAIAKRSGDKWYLGVINNSHPRQIKLDTSFLTPGKHVITSWSDGKKTTTDFMAAEKKTGTLTGGRLLPVKLAAAGGYVAVIE